METIENVGMGMYMMAYKQQAKQGNEWVDMNFEEYTFLFIAKDIEEALQHSNAALEKVNAYAEDGKRYVAASDVKSIYAISLAKDIHMRTSITGIW